MNFIRKKQSSASRFPILPAISLLIFTQAFSQVKNISCNITDQLITIRNANISLAINNEFQPEIFFEKNGVSSRITKENNISAAIFLSGPHNNSISFKRKAAQIEKASDKSGNGETVKVEGVSADGRLLCNVSFSVYGQIPNTILMQASFKNISGNNYPVQAYTLNHLYLDHRPDQNKWWSFQGASYYWGQDFSFELPRSFTRDNYMGLNDIRAGSGIPLVDVWNKEFGIALAYVGEKPRDIYLPVKAENGEVQLAIRENYTNGILRPNDSLVAVQTALIGHRNDFYDPLQTYARLMKPLLPDFKKPTDFAYQPEWCTWGYGRDFKPADIQAKLPHLKSLGIKSVILDDGWSAKHGDWVPDAAKFPNGDEDFKRLISKIHYEGLKVWLWWLPGYADSTSHLVAQHPDWLVKNRDGSVHPSYALCPAYLPVQEYYKRLVRKFVAEYKLDGLKLDFQEINSAPPCYNPAHHHKDPLQSYYSTPVLFKNIYQNALRFNPGMLIEYCSCGIPPSIFHLPWVNLAVTSDPGIAQITQRIKMYKALLGNDFPVLEEYCGVLAGPLYPLTIGTGGVPGTFSTYLDTLHDKWLSIYYKNQLSKGGQYLNLYDVGFDYPEAHVIKKDGKFYYAFYTHPWGNSDSTSRLYRFGSEFDSGAAEREEFKYPEENYSGKIQLRGLDKNKAYRVVEYASNRQLGTVKGSQPYLNVLFDNYLLLEVYPVDKELLK